MAHATTLTFADPIFSTPLEVLARRHNPQMSDSDVAQRIASAVHEATHFLLACIFRATITQVTISNARNPTSGALGSVQSIERLPEESAIVSLAGVAFEERFGDPALAAQDLRSGRHHAAVADIPFENFMTYARELVDEDDSAFRLVAQGILGLMPKSGILKGRKLQKLVALFMPPMRQYLQWLRGPRYVGGRFVGSRPETREVPVAQPEDDSVPDASEDPLDALAREVRASSRFMPPVLVCQASKMEAMWVRLPIQYVRD
jgi:hypothetical protein